MIVGSGALGTEGSGFEGSLGVGSDGSGSGTSSDIDGSELDVEGSASLGSGCIGVLSHTSGMLMTIYPRPSRSCAHDGYLCPFGILALGSSHGYLMLS